MEPSLETSAIERRTMKSIDPKLRADAGKAKSVIIEVFKGSEPSGMRGYLTFLHDSIKFLSTSHNDSWGITLFGDGIRLNVGWVEVLVLREDGLDVLVERELAPTGTTFKTDGYKWAPGCDLTRVPFSKLHRTLPTLSEAHLSALSIAGKRKTNSTIREAHSTGVTAFLSEFLHQPVPSPSYQAKPQSGRDYLVLWKYAEAMRVNGLVMTGAEGTHADGLAKGDRVFVVATRSDELYLLGAIEVQRSGDREAEGKSMFGVFHIIPLKGLKWQLRFEATQSPKLTKDKSVAWQVRSRRLLSEGSARLLGDVLLRTQLAQEEVEVQEGKTTRVTLTTRERSRELRVLALANRGTVCEICGFDFAVIYGEFARNCVEVHHLELLSGAGRDGVTTALDDVLVVCPNCHRALHQFRDPSDWKAFRKACRLK
jgi:hypothetical protein